MAVDIRRRSESDRTPQWTEQFAGLLVLHVRGKTLANITQRGDGGSYQACIFGAKGLEVDEDLERLKERVLRIVLDHVLKEQLKKGATREPREGN
jgi:hypothetical protein